LSAWYTREAPRVVPTSTPRALAVGRTVRALADAEVLPAEIDVEATRKPIGRAWVRRVSGQNLWLWFRVTDEEVVLITISTDPPVPD